MAVGIKVWDELGNLVFDTSSRFTRLLGHIPTSSTPTTAKTITVAAKYGKPFVVWSGDQNGLMWPGGTLSQPSISGQTITYYNGDFWYGVY